MISIRIIKSAFFYFNPPLANSFIQIGLSACILIGPFLFLYFRTYITKKNTGWGKHILPYLIGITALGIFYPYVEHRIIWSRWIVKGIYIQWIIYTILSFRFIRPIIDKLKKKEQLKNIDIWLISIYIGVSLILLAYSIGAYTSYLLGLLSFSFILYLIILLVIFKQLKKKTTFFEEKEKYQNKDIEENILKKIEAGILQVINEKLFTNPDMTLQKMSEVLNVPKHILSQFLNDKLGKSFSTFINELRVEEAKRLLLTNNTYTIESIGYECGFYSKSTFFSAFKKHTDKTPSEYRLKMKSSTNS